MYMKDKKTDFWGKVFSFSLPFLWFVAFSVWFVRLSDFAGKYKHSFVNIVTHLPKIISKISTSDLITLLFLFVFLVVIIGATKKLVGIASISSDLTYSSQELRKSADKFSSFDKIKDSFANKKLKKLYEDYQHEFERLKVDLPDGVGCDIEEYFNEENLASVLHADRLNQIPGALSGLGMLGTFVGLTLGLSQFNFLGSSTKIAEGVDPLLSSIKVAFFTSILGLILSIVFNAIYRTLNESVEKSLVEFVASHHIANKDDSHNSINKLLSIQSQQRDSIINFPDRIVDSISRGLEPLINDMELTYTKACERLKEAQFEGMEVLVNQFTKQLIGTLDETAKSLTSVVEKSSVIQSEMQTALENQIEKVISLSKDTEKLYQLSADTVTTLCEHSEIVHSYVDDLVDKIEINNKVLSDYSNHFEVLNNATSGLIKATTINADVSEKIIGVVCDFNENNEKVQQKINDKVEEFTGIYDRVTTRITEIEKHVVNEFQTVTDGMVGEAKKAVETLKNEATEISDQIDSRAKEFIDDVSTKSESFISDFNNNAEKTILAVKNKSDELTETFVSQLNQIKDDVSRNTENQLKHIVDAYSNDMKRTGTEVVKSINDAAQKMKKVTEDSSDV